MPCCCCLGLPPPLVKGSESGLKTHLPTPPHLMQTLTVRLQAPRLLRLPSTHLAPPTHPIRAEIEICKRPDGTDWELGAGGFGKVGAL